MLVCLVRHGETDWNLKNILNGTTDIPLNETGVLQSKKTAEFLKMERKWTSIYSSPLLRSVQTGKEIQNQLGIPLKIENCLIERDYGCWEGHDISKINFKEIINDVESSQEVINRIIPFMEYLTENYNDNDGVIVVTHGSIIRHIFNIIDPFASEIKTVNNNSISYIRYYLDKKVWDYKFMNQIIHLQ